VRFLHSTWCSLRLGAHDVEIIGGENISSVALESMLVQHPDVPEAGVVSTADLLWRERPKASIT
jgi:acyl-coenzyme A synthetase/AMP-(fatty) acid ligase